MPCGYTGALTVFRMSEALAARTTDCSDSGERRRLGPNQNGVGQETGKALQGSRSSSRLHLQNECQLEPKHAWNSYPKGQIQGQSEQFNAINRVPLALNSSMCLGSPASSLILGKYVMSQLPYLKTGSNKICLEL